MAFFNPEASLIIRRGKLPHWRQEGVIYFVTFHLADSLPRAKLEWLRREKELWLELNPEPHTDSQQRECYELGEFVVMPNHVHAVVAPIGAHQLTRILHDWKSFSAHQFNRVLTSSGRIWHRESFDHIVRSAEALAKFDTYIRNNPKK
jgi:hypothetical protein